MNRAKLFLLFVAISALAWCVVVPLFVLLFSWTEYISGINWLYLPHGLRMILVLLFGIAGAFGFTIGAQVLRWADLDGITPNPLIDLPMMFVPAIAAYGAAVLTIRAWPGRTLLSQVGQGIPAIDGRRLILLAFVSAILNSAGHTAVHAIYGKEQQPIDDYFVIMFIGDFFGALLLLYALKRLVVFIENRKERTGPL